MSLDDLFSRNPISAAVKAVQTAVSAVSKKPKVSELSIVKTLKTTPRVFVENSKNVVIKELKRGNTRAGFPGVKAVAKDIFSKPGVRGRSHKCSIIAMDSKPVHKSKSVYFSCDCITGDTRVLTDKGYQYVFELAEPYRPGYYPLKYNVDGVLYAGSAPFYKGRQSVYEVKFANGLSLKATANHEFLVDNGHRYENYFVYGDGPKQYSHSKRVSLGKSWIELKDLEVGDRLVLNSFQPKISTCKVKLADGFFLGVLMGDGTLTGKHQFSRADLQLYKHDAQEILDVVALSGTVLTVQATSRSGFRVTFNNRARELLARYKYKNKQSVDISDYSVFLGYVAGLFVTDGSLHRNGLKINGGSYLKHLQEMFLTFGFHDCRLVLERPAGTQTNLGTSTKDMYRLTLGISSIRKLLPLIGHLITDKKRTKLEAVSSKKAQVRNPTTEVVSVAWAGTQDVYDIDVPGPTRFTANGIIIHNCEAYMYWCEVALNRYGASAIKFSNGEAPDTRNPQKLPMICKHLISLAYECKKNGF